MTPRRYESGEVSRNGRISKRGDIFTRKWLFEATNAIFYRNLGRPVDLDLEPCGCCFSNEHLPPPGLLIHQGPGSMTWV
ncbi:transposase [Pelagibacterium montanilacus]|uniref:transposase n=1 Tax=Pelagibacterium montanilacus TaxID=2185280 RepID=UPI001FE622D6|nr:transposase [Pelagibacterium montanilacus]